MISEYTCAPSFPCPALVSLWHSRRGETWLLRPQLGRAQPSLVQLGWVFCYVTVLTAATALIPHMHSRRTKGASQLLCTCSFYCWVDNLHSSMILICSWESDWLWFFPWWEWVKGCLNMSWKMAGQWLRRWMVMSWYQRKFILNNEKPHQLSAQRMFPFVINAHFKKLPLRTLYMAPFQ